MFTSPEDAKGMALRAALYPPDSLEARVLGHWPLIVSSVNDRAGPSLLAYHRAEDLIQDIALAALESGKRMSDCGEPAFRGWLSTVARQVILGRARATPIARGLVRVFLWGEGGTAADPAEVVVDRKPRPSERAANREFLARARAALASLSFLDRQAMLLHCPELFYLVEPPVSHRLAGHAETYAECARALQCSPRAVAGRVAHGWRHLRREMGRRRYAGGGASRDRQGEVLTAAS